MLHHIFGLLNQDSFPILIFSATILQLPFFHIQSSFLHFCHFRSKSKPGYFGLISWSIEPIVNPSISVASGGPNSSFLDSSDLSICRTCQVSFSLFAIYGISLYDTHNSKEEKLKNLENLEMDSKGEWNDSIGI